MWTLISRFLRANLDLRKFLPPFLYILGRNFHEFYVLAMSHSLQWWFKPVDAMPVPNGPLCDTISPATIRDVNEEVRKASTSSTPSRGAYIKVASEQQAKNAQYASLHGNAAAVRRFSKELGFAIKESSVRSWKTKYQMEIQRKRAKLISR